MKVLVTGDREWGPDDVDLVFRELSKLPPGTIIVHGVCRGVDTIAGIVAEQLGFTVREYPARWDVLGRAAGQIRNQVMIDHEHLEREPIDLVLAFHYNISASKGTSGMISLAQRAGLNVQLISS